MAGIYIHFPFCRHKCSYCNFFSVASSRYRRELTDGLHQELIFRKHYLDGEPVETIYLGGGTPSLLSQSELQHLLDNIFHHFQVDSHAEITLEANPDDLDREYVRNLGKTAVNRVSVGVQSFADKDLAFLDRNHSAMQAEDSIKRLQDAGFENLSIDLIYGIPTLDNKAWQDNITRFLSLQVPHLSAYALTVEEKTPLHHFILKGKKLDVDENHQATHFEILTELMLSSGYQHYEISNFALPGRYARHNTAYWQGRKYLGIGPSAHSYNGDSRQWNISSITEYIRSLSTGIVPFEKESLTREQKFNEFVMTSLRTMWGCDLTRIAAEFEESWVEQLLADASEHLNHKLLKVEGNILKLTKEGLFMADGIAASLFRV